MKFRVGPNDRMLNASTAAQLLGTLMFTRLKAAKQWSNRGNEGVTCVEGWRISCSDSFHANLFSYSFAGCKALHRKGKWFPDPLSKCEHNLFSSSIHCVRKSVFSC